MTGCDLRRAVFPQYNAIGGRKFSGMLTGDGRGKGEKTATDGGSA